ncbi:MAG: right-handed parallel beta-helix repeat-containing protein [Chloroflexi bacterium]|nr:right-handed parallel beta-helix repeat-containing protein [Chloroflexota bacterium]MCI0577845.1 right-handed parallel beta-helix repeat-containing protein [Chloroflexota bacterium]MCI0729848.1 right-handed parallel beta-helix repeat-containing protein [Chloroflexota bacterium]
MRNQTHVEQLISVHAIATRVKTGLILAGLCLALLIPVAGCSSAQATAVKSGGNTYYIAPGGDDDNPGTIDEPWATIQHAADVVTAGDTVLVRGGVYNEQVTVNVSGSAAEGYVTFQSYPGETAILDGTGLTVPAADNGLFLIDSQSYLILDGFELRNYTTGNAGRVPIGIYVAGDAHHIQVKNNHLHHIETNAGPDGNAHGIAVYGTEAPSSVHDLLIEGNELHDLKLGNSEALVLNGNVELFTVTLNLVYDSDNIGLDFIGFEETSPDPAYDQARDGIVSENVVYNIDTANNPAYGGEQSAAGIYVDGGTRIVIERNRVYLSNFGVEIASEHAGRATSYVTVRNNLIYHNHVAGLAMGGYDTLRGSTHGCAIVNNTFFENDASQDGTGELLIQFDTHDNIIQNNIFYANDQSLFVSNDFVENENNVVDDNLYFAPAGPDFSEWGWQTVYYTGFDAYQSGTGNDPNSLFADPQFLSTITPDLHLLGTSPAIDQGENLVEAGTMDFDGNPRIHNGQIDVGAFEFIVLSQVMYLPLLRRE